MVALFLLGSKTPNSLVVPTIAFVAAVQVTSFQAVSDWQFNSAMTTGNFRATLNALMLWRARKDPAQNRKAFLATGSICLFFTLGALCGGICSRFCPRQALLALHLGNHHRCGRRKDTVIVPVLSTRKGLQTIFTKRQTTLSNSHGVQRQSEEVKLTERCVFLKVRGLTVCRVFLKQI